MPLFYVMIIVGQRHAFAVPWRHCETNGSEAISIPVGIEIASSPAANRWRTPRNDGGSENTALP